MDDNGGKKKAKSSYCLASGRDTAELGMLTMAAVPPVRVREAGTASSRGGKPGKKGKSPRKVRYICKGGDVASEKVIKNCAVIATPCVDST